MNNQDNIKKTFTFLFTDIEGSTQLIQELKDGYAEVLHRHQEIIRSIVTKHGGNIADTAGDGLFCVFKSAIESVRSAVAIQKSISEFSVKNSIRIKLRSGIHTGDATISASGYTGYDIHLTSRIMSAGYGGQILISETVKKIIENDLTDELEIIFLGEYELKDISLPQRIYQINYSGSEKEYPALKASSLSITNLPHEIVKLIGRENDIKSLIHIIRERKTRLVTLTGPGGIGKTSLALNVCKELTGDFKNGVFYVVLSDIYEMSLIAECIALSMKISEKIYSEEDNLISYLKSKKILILLDNIEQIKGEPEFVKKLLLQCPEVFLIITSRIPLKLKHETEYELTSLKLPDFSTYKKFDDVSQYSAMMLFEERAARVKSGFRINENNAAAVAEICVQLDGLPLAIELACARIKIFSPNQILQKLNDKLNLLKVTEPDRPQRHHTLRDTISWSYDLLNDKEKSLFEILSIFTGGCTFEAVEHVSKDQFESDIELIDTLQNLTEKNLIRQKEDSKGNNRYGMLVMIHEFANEKLNEKENLYRELNVRHSNYYLNLSEEAEKHFTGKDLTHWLDIIESDIGNIRYCITFAESEGDSETALKFCAALWRYWIIRGNLNHDYKQLRSVLNMPFAENLKAVRAKVLNGVGTMLHELSDYKLSYPYIEESLKLHKELEDTHGILTALLNLSWVSIHLGELRNAEEMSREVLIINEKTKDKRVSALLHNNLGWLFTMRGNFSEAKNNYLLSLQMRNEIDDTRGLGFVNANIAWIETFMGDYSEAENIFIKSLDIIKNINDKQLLGWAFSNYGFLDFCRYDLESAEKRVKESLEMMSEVYNEWGMTYEKLLLAYINFHKNHKEEAESLIDTTLKFFLKSGSRWGMERALIFKSVLLIDSGLHKRANESLTEALGYADYLNDKYGYSLIFESYAYIYNKMKMEEQAAGFLSTADKIRMEIHAPLSIPEMKLREKFVKDLKIVGDIQYNLEEAKLIIQTTKI